MAVDDNGTPVRMDHSPGHLPASGWSDGCPRVTIRRQPDGPAVITLYVLQGADKGKRFDLPGNEPIPLGRASEVAPLTDLTVSRKHAHLELRKVGWVLLDEGSSNGVFVNGVRINKQCNVKIGDQIR